MTIIDRKRLVPPTLTPDEADMARTAQRVLMESLDHSKAASITIVSQTGQGPTVAVPPQALRLISKVLGLLAQRQPVTLLREKQEFTTVEAANYLNVSRPFVIKEIEAGRLKHRLVGSHRRILFEDLLEYANAMRAGQQAALDRMAEDARARGLEY